MLILLLKLLLFICNGIVVHVQLNVFQISSEHKRGKKTESLVRRDEPSFYSNTCAV